MINALMFGALGFFLGCLLALMLAPPLWNRAVKLTTRKLEATMPMSLNDIQADKDQLRAEFAIELRKVEVALEKAKEKADPRADRGEQAPRRDLHAEHRPCRGQRPAPGE